MSVPAEYVPPPKRDASLPRADQIAARIAWLDENHTWLLRIFGTARLAFVRDWQVKQMADPGLPSLAGPIIARMREARQEREAIDTAVTALEGEWRGGRRAA